MSKRFVSHLSVPNLIAMIALVVAVGTGAAFGLPGKGSIDKNDIVKNAIKSKHVKKNALSGADIKEKKLGQVPSAASAERAGHADTADTANTAASAAEAGNAATLGGLSPAEFERAGKLKSFDERVAIGATNVEIASLGPFRLVGSCLLSGGGGTQLVPDVNVTTTENDSIAFTTQFTSGDTPLVVSDGDFDVGETLDFAAYQESTPVSIVSAADGRMAAPSGANVTVNLILGSRVFSNNPSDRVGCVFAGSAIVDPP